MKKILCYGDSNVFGFVPELGTRYEKSQRWSGILGSILSTEYEIIEQGMNNRTGFFKNPEGLKISGGEYLPIFLEKNKDIDICILALGTNDAQFIYSLDENVTLWGLEHLISCIKKANRHTKIIIIPPVQITEAVLDSSFSVLFDLSSIQRIKRVMPIFKQVADENNCYFFDFNLFVSPSEQDGIHYTADSHRIIAEKLALFIATL